MLTTERSINQFFRSTIHQLMKDIPADRINERPPGDGHPPLWILGHLAICAEFGEAILGQQMQHPEWVAIFGPGSSDNVANPEAYSAEELIKVIDEAYPRLMDLIDKTPADALNADHSIELLQGGALVSVADVQAHLLTSHVAFHTAQLSSWRRAAGFGPLF
ncbi:MAG: DinB family protein [Fuerstiella sp.]